MKYVPINKTTRVKYPAISENEKIEMEKSAVTKRLYYFEPIAEATKEPIEAKMAKPEKKAKEPSEQSE